MKVWILFEAFAGEYEVLGVYASYDTAAHESAARTAEHEERYKNHPGARATFHIEEWGVQ